MARRLRPLLRAATAQLAGQVCVQTQRSAVLVAGFLAPTGERVGVAGMYSGKRHDSGFNVQAVADLAGRLVDTACPARAAGTKQGSARVRHRRPVGRPSATRRPRHARRPGLPGTAAITGVRKPPKGELTDIQRDCNRSINSARAAPECAIAPPDQLESQ
jgi:hypothetical protein